VRPFVALGIAYAVGGSLASSLHGIPRSTDDVDLVAAIERPHVDRLVAAWGSAYYTDAGMMHDAIAERSSFNIIHLGRMLKIDVFIAGDDPLVIEELCRAQPRQVADSLPPPG